MAGGVRSDVLVAPDPAGEDLQVLPRLVGGDWPGQFLDHGYQFCQCRTYGKDNPPSVLFGAEPQEFALDAFGGIELQPVRKPKPGIAAEKEPGEGRVEGAVYFLLPPVLQPLPAFFLDQVDPFGLDVLWRLVLWDGPDQSFLTGFVEDGLHPLQRGIEGILRHPAVALVALVVPEEGYSDLPELEAIASVMLQPVAFASITALRGGWQVLFHLLDKFKEIGRARDLNTSGRHLLSALDAGEDIGLDLVDLVADRPVVERGVGVAGDLVVLPFLGPDAQASLEITYFAGDGDGDHDGACLLAIQLVGPENRAYGMGHW